MTQGFYRYFPTSERDREWGLFVTTTGETRSRPGEPYPPAGHPKGYSFQWRDGRVLRDYAVVYISRGSGWFESCHTRRQRLEAGTVFLLFPGVWHRYIPDPETGWDDHWVAFDGSIPRHWTANKFFSPRQPVLKPLQDEALLALFRRLIETAKANPPALQQVMSGLVVEIAGLLYSARQTDTTEQPQSVSAIQQAIERLQADLATNLDLQDLARELGVSYSWFRRAFANHTGLSPHQYLLELRLARARDLLAHTSLAVKEVAYQVGFEDENYFCRLFRRKTTLTPTDWRTSARPTDLPRNGLT